VARRKPPPSIAFKTFGFDIQGEAKVEPQVVQLNLTLPFTGDDVQGKDRTDVATQLTRLLG